MLSEAALLSPSKISFHPLKRLIKIGIHCRKMQPCALAQPTEFWFAEGLIILVTMAILETSISSATYFIIYRN